MVDAPRPLWLRLLRGLAGVVLALALAEGLVALAVPEPARGIHFAARSAAQHALDPLLIWRARPTPPDAAGSDRVTAGGLRNTELGVKQPDEIRVLAIGDDATYGSGLPTADAYPAKLEAELRAQGLPATVLNAGQPGYGSDQVHRAFVSRWAQIGADLVIAGVHCSDLAGDIDQPLYDVRGGGLVGLDARFNWIYLQGTANQLVPELLSKRKLYRWLLSGLDHANPFGQVPFRSEEALRDWQRDKIALEMDDIERIGRARGFTLAVVILPCLDSIAGVPSPPLYGDLAERLRAHGTAVLDADAAFRARGGDPVALFQPKSQLLDAQGNAALADAVAGFLRSQSLLHRGGAARPARSG
jgi:hypothetical protein